MIPFMPDYLKLCRASVSFRRFCWRVKCCKHVQPYLLQLKSLSYAVAGILHVLHSQSLLMLMAILINHMPQLLLLHAAAATESLMLL